MVDSPSGGAPAKAPRWDLADTEGVVVEIVFRDAPQCFQGMGIYIGEGSTSVEQQGAHEGGGRAQGVSAPPASWPPRLFVDAHS